MAGMPKRRRRRNRRNPDLPEVYFERHDFDDDGDDDVIVWVDGKRIYSSDDPDDVFDFGVIELMEKHGASEADAVEYVMRAYEKFERHDALF